LLGIRQLVVLVNKMDLENFSRSRFDQLESEYRSWLKVIGLDPKIFIPVSARTGDNVGSRSAAMPWWEK
jgi:bifunctional enzyme CysN/CysC